MNSLYNKDVSSEIKELKEKIQKQQSFSAQDIILYFNYKNYSTARDDNQCLIKNCIEELYSAYYPTYLDESFQAAFAGEYGQRIFELVMADFLAKNFNLMPKEKTQAKQQSPIPDFLFEHQGNTYYLECTTRSIYPNLEKFYKNIHLFGDYYDIWHKVLHSPEKPESITIATLKIYLKRIISSLSNELGKEIKEVFKHEKSGEKIAELMIGWLSNIKQIYAQHREFIPEKILTKITQIPYLTTDHSPCVPITWVKAIACCICDKINKNYDSQSPLIIGVSLALILSYLNAEMNNLLKEIENKLIGFIHEELAKPKYRSKREILIERLRNVYAILINRIYVDWFPEYAEKMDGTHFPETYKNCYGIIYNSDFLKQHPIKIFDSCTNHKIEIPFLSPATEILVP